jgi:hypothetical protein
MKSSKPFCPIARGISLCYALFFFLLYPLAAAGIETESVEVDGTAVVQNSNLAQARDQAIANALRGALEKTLSSAVAQPVPASGKAAIHDKIYTVTERYILNYRILREAEQDGSYVVRVAATVDSGVLKADLRSLGVLGGQKEGRQSPGSVVILIVQGTFAGHHDLLTFREMLAGMPPVRSVATRFLSQNRTEMILESGGDAQAVARELSKKRFKGVPLRVLRVEAASIEIAINNQGVSRD